MFFLTMLNLVIGTAIQYKTLTAKVDASAAVEPETSAGDEPF
jgi:hypothetical protein